VPAPLSFSDRSWIVQIRWKGFRLSKIERSIVIDRPIDEVFNFVHQPRNDASWQTTLIESSQVDDGPLRVGTQIRERRRFLGIQVEMTKEITEFEPLTRSAFNMVAGGAPMSGAYSLESLTMNNSGTSIELIGTNEWIRTSSTA
jgi:hypothetical protein